MNIINSYNEIISHNTVVIFDLETTGLNRSKDRIIEIGAIKVVNGRITDKLSMLVNPGIPVPYYATKVNGITNAMLEGKTGDNDGVRAFYEFAKDALLVAHNISFDLGFINEYLLRLELPLLNNRVVDTVRLARKAFPGKPKYKLEIIAKELGISVENAHRADDDARVCYELFVKSLEELRKE